MMEGKKAERHNVKEKLMTVRVTSKLRNILKSLLTILVLHKALEQVQQKNLLEYYLKLIFLETLLRKWILM